MLDRAVAEKTQNSTMIANKDKEIEELTLRCKIQQYVAFISLKNFTDLSLLHTIGKRRN